MLLVVCQLSKCLKFSPIFGYFYILLLISCVSETARAVEKCCSAEWRAVCGRGTAGLPGGASATERQPTGTRQHASTPPARQQPHVSAWQQPHVSALDGRCLLFRALLPVIVLCALISARQGRLRSVLPLTRVGQSATLCRQGAGHFSVGVCDHAAGLPRSATCGAACL